jgi:phenylpropionate dioxygenase-like ring-hydroxylating dioxygenase large terminal subunit
VHTVVVVDGWMYIRPLSLTGNPLADSDVNLVTAIDLRREYFTLPPREYYVGDRIFAEEFDKVFSRQWIYAGHLSEFPRRGSFMNVDFAGEKILIVRGEGGEFYGHFNVCRHRGYPLCEGETGTVRAIVCPYHQWRYDLDGVLTRVPGMSDGEFFDYRDFGLKRIHVETWHDMVFFHLGGNPQPLRSCLDQFDSSVAPFNIEGTRLAHAETLDLEANWKVSAENFNECYHCPGSHRSFCRVIDVPRMQQDAEVWFDLDRPGGAFAGGGSGMPLVEGMQTLSASGSLTCTKLLGDCTLDDAAVGRNTGINMLPNYFYAGFYVDHWWAQSVRPISPTRSRMVFRWYVREDAIEGTDYDVDVLTRLTRDTYLEDVVLIEKTYKGILSQTFTPGPIVARTEPLMYSFVAAYWSMMGPAPQPVDQEIGQVSARA